MNKKLLPYPQFLMISLTMTVVFMLRFSSQIQLEGSIENQQGQNSSVLLRWQLLPETNTTPYLFVIERSEAGANQFQIIGKSMGKKEWKDTFVQKGKSYQYRIRLSESSPLYSNVLSIQIP